MDERTIQAYVRLEDEIQRGPQNYGGDAAIASLRAFRAYHPKAHISIHNVDGRKIWLTPKMGRILAICQRTSGSSNQMTTIRAMAAEAQVSPGYASKVLARLEQLSLVRYVTSRGRWGAIARHSAPPIPSEAPVIKTLFPV